MYLDTVHCVDTMALMCLDNAKGTKEETQVCQNL